MANEAIAESPLDAGVVSLFRNGDGDIYVRVTDAEDETRVASTTMPEAVLLEALRALGYVVAKAGQ